jgi:hypothetical protein
MLRLVGPMASLLLAQPVGMNFLTRTSGVVIALSASLAVATPSHGQDLDPASIEALSATLTVLSDPGPRSPAVANDARMAALHAWIRSLDGSSELAREFYEFVAALFGELAQESNDGGQPLPQALEHAKADPSAFAASLSPETLQRLRALALKLSDAAR